MPIKEETTKETFFTDLIGSLDTRKASHNAKIYRFLTFPQIIETIPSCAIVPQYQHPTDQGKLSKLREHTTKSLANKFDIITLDDSAKQILNNYNL